MYFRVREQDCPHRLLSPQAPILKSMTEFTGKKKSKRKGKKNTFVIFSDPQWATSVRACFIFTD